MAEYKAKVTWKRESPDFDFETYNRDHDWTFDSGATVRASASPEYKGNPDCINPGWGFLASIASCHMLTFLAIANRRRFVVDDYQDEVAGIMEKGDDGRTSFTRVTLRPRVTFSGDRTPTPEELQQLHDQAHRACFVANSVKSEVILEPVTSHP